MENVKYSSHMFTSFNHFTSCTSRQFQSHNGPVVFINVLGKFRMHQSFMMLKQNCILIHDRLTLKDADRLLRQNTSVARSAMETGSRYVKDLRLRIEFRNGNLTHAATKNLDKVKFQTKYRLAKTLLGKCYYWNRAVAFGKCGR